MKIELKDAFSPIVITLETQREVDQLFAVLNFSPIYNAIESDGWDKVRAFLSDKRLDYTTWHVKLKKHLGR